MAATAKEVAAQIRLCGGHVYKTRKDEKGVLVMVDVEEDDQEITGEFSCYRRTIEAVAQVNRRCKGWRAKRNGCRIVARKEGA